ncbi:MAG TPA: nickel-binding protein [Actinomycetota bacterium]
MGIYLVERYVPGLTEAGHRTHCARALQVTTAMSPNGVAVTFLGSTFIPDEEAVLCLFEGRSAEDVVEANRRVGLHVDRITRAVPVRPSDLRRRQAR